MFQWSLSWFLLRDGVKNLAKMVSGIWDAFYKGTSIDRVMFRDFWGKQISALEFVNNPLKLIAVLYFFHISHCGFVMKYSWRIQRSQWAIQVGWVGQFTNLTPHLEETAWVSLLWWSRRKEIWASQLKEQITISLCKFFDIHDQNWECIFSKAEKFTSLMTCFKIV